MNLQHPAAELIRALAAYTMDRGEHPTCAFCGNDMQDGLNNAPDRPEASDGHPDPEHQYDCPVVKARIMLSKLQQGQEV